MVGIPARVQYTKKTRHSARIRLGDADFDASVDSLGNLNEVFGGVNGLRHAENPRRQEDSEGSKDGSRPPH